MDSIALRDKLALKRTILEQLVAAAGIPRERGFGVTRSEIKFRPTVDIAELQKEIETLAKQYRELDRLIQTRNFEAEGERGQVERVGSGVSWSDHAGGGFAPVTKRLPYFCQKRSLLDALIFWGE